LIKTSIPVLDTVKIKARTGSLSWRLEKIANCGTSDFQKFCHFIKSRHFDGRQLGNRQLGSRHNTVLGEALTSYLVGIVWCGARLYVHIRQKSSNLTSNQDPILGTNASHDTGAVKTSNTTTNLARSYN
jgi:hypothetical protein